MQFGDGYYKSHNYEVTIVRIKVYSPLGFVLMHSLHNVHEINACNLGQTISICLSA
jgi:hypothetical protein